MTEKLNSAQQAWWHREWIASYLYEQATYKGRTPWVKLPRNKKDEYREEADQLAVEYKAAVEAEVAHT